MSNVTQETERKEMPGNFFGSYLIGEEEIAEAVEVLKSRSIFRYYGPNVLGKADQFEEDLKRFHDVEHALGVASGTAALKCALQALGVGAGDEVIVPAYGFIATAGAVVSCHAVPVFCDIDESMNMDPADLENRITSRTKAIIPVHIMGIAANLNPILQIAAKHGLPVVEDAAQSFGGRYFGKSLGTIGDIGCFSFQANKILSTGEGGAVITNTEHLYLGAKTYHDQGGVRIGASFPSWDHEEAFFGENLRISELTAAIGIAQLKKMPGMLDKVRSLKKLLRECLQDLNLNYRTVWDENGDCGISECFYVEDPALRNEIIAGMREAGINAHGYYNTAVYENRLFQNIQFADSTVSYKLGICPNAEKLSRQTLWIPTSPLYSEDDIRYIADTLRNLLRK